MTQQTFGAALRAAREAAGLSQAEMARRIGCIRNQLYETELGKRLAFPVSRVLEIATRTGLLNAAPLMALAATERGIDEGMLADCRPDAVEVLLDLLLLLPTLPRKKVAALKRLLQSL